MEALRFVWNGLWQRTRRAGAIRLVVALGTLASALVLFVLRVLATTRLGLDAAATRTLDLAIALLTLCVALELGLGAVVFELLRLEDADERRE